jgi:hypothetical protein
VRAEFRQLATLHRFSFSLVPSSAMIMDSKKSYPKDAEANGRPRRHSRSNSSSSILRSRFRWPVIKGRRLLFATCACLVAASLFGLLSGIVWTHQLEPQFVLDKDGEIPKPPEPIPDKWSPLTVLRGPATESLWGASEHMLSSRPKLNSFEQTTYATTQSIYPRGRQQAGVRHSNLFRCYFRKPILS